MWSSTLNQSNRYPDKRRDPKGPKVQLTVRTASLLKGLSNVAILRGVSHEMVIEDALSAYVSERYPAVHAVYSDVTTGL